MYREEALKLLLGGMEGIAEWNRRRQAGEEIPQLCSVELTGAYLCGAMLAGVDLSNCSLAGAVLVEADLSGAVLNFTDFSGADLSHCRAIKACLIGANLSTATLRAANFRHAQLINTRLEGANLANADLHGADLSQANLTRANLTSTDLSSSLLVNASLHHAVLRSANFERAELMGVKYNRRTIVCQGIRVDASHGNAVFKRDAQDQDWIETFRSQSRWHYCIYLFWAVFTDCGRSLTRTCLAAIALALGFGSVYAYHPTLLNTSRSVQTAWTPFYFSFVTFTTLGFGDVTPGSLAGELIVTVQVVLGYVTLGVLVAILANKVARRS